jgi:hypothetical protein
MKHARQQALDDLEDLLVRIRRRPELREKTRGVFYRTGVAFLHFHEDPAGLFADLRLGADWERFPVNTEAERRRLLARLGGKS